MKTDPHVSIVIPVHNEGRILRAAVEGLRCSLLRFSSAHEIILAENGSSDDTLAIAEAPCNAQSLSEQGIG